MDLRGFDSYDISLGDEMRGERASLGKSLADAERDMRIKARMITAIEDCDLSGFPNQSVIAGYVRSYARYLGMDAEDCYRRFCHESGYQSPATLQSTTGRIEPANGRPAGAVVSAVGSEIARSRFAAPPVQNRFYARISLGAVTSSAALVGLIAALSYGGYALLQDIQRVGFAPLPEAPTVVTDAPQIGAPQIDVLALRKPEARDYRGGGALAKVTDPTPLPPLSSRRDGPISAINPETAGVFAALQRSPVAPEESRRIDSADEAIAAAAAVDLSAGAPLTSPDLAQSDAETTLLAETGITLHAAEEAWVRVRGRDNDVLFEGILAPGEQFSLPDPNSAARLKAGNAGGVYVLVNGVAYGPVGRRGQVARNVSLAEADILANMPPTELAIPEPAGDETQQQASARLDR